MHFHSYLQHPGVFQPRLQDLKIKLSLLFTAFQSCLALAPGSEYVFVLFFVNYYLLYPRACQPWLQGQKDSWIVVWGRQSHNRLREGCPPAGQSHTNVLHNRGHDKLVDFCLPHNTLMYIAINLAGALSNHHSRLYNHTFYTLLGKGIQWTIRAIIMFFYMLLGTGVLRKWRMPQLQSYLFKYFWVSELYEKWRTSQL